MLPRFTVGYKVSLISHILSKLTFQPHRYLVVLLVCTKYFISGKMYNIYQRMKVTGHLGAITRICNTYMQLFTMYKIVAGSNLVIYKIFVNVKSSRHSIQSIYQNYIVALNKKAFNVTRDPG